MKKQIRRRSGFLKTAVLVLCMLATGRANAEFTWGSYGFDNIQITGYNDIVPSYLEIPESIDWGGRYGPSGVVSIKGFANCLTLNTLRINKQSLRFEDAAFQNCKFLSEMQLSYSFITTGAFFSYNNIAESAFIGCDNLNVLRLLFNGGDGNMDLMYSSTINNAPASFKQNIKKIIIEEGITDFAWLYNWPSLESISIPSTATNGYVYYGCPKLREITIANGNTTFMTVNKILYRNDMGTLLRCPPMVPWDGKLAPQTTEIYGYAFADCQIPRELDLRVFDAIDREVSQLKTIGGNVFGDYPEITKVTLPSTVTSIGHRAFQGCANLKALVILGDAPPQNLVFGSTTDVGYPKDCTVYYQSDTKGWGTTWAGRPAEPLAMSYTVTFDPNTVTFDPWNEGNIEMGEASRTVTVGQRYGDLPTPTWTTGIELITGIEHQFTDWFTTATEAEGGTPVTADMTVEPLGPRTLYARWKDVFFDTSTVTFQTNGVTMATQILRVGKEYGTLPEPTRDGYVFTRWERFDGTPVTEKTPVPQGNHTLFAQWKENTCTVGFDMFPSPSHPSTFYKEVTPGAPYGDLPEVKGNDWPNGYRFTGWYTGRKIQDSFYGSVLIIGDEVIPSTPVTQTTYHTLYARWVWRGVVKGTVNENIRVQNTGSTPRPPWDSPQNIKEIVDLPPGVEIKAGTLSGKPTRAGTFTTTIKWKDGSTDDTIIFDIVPARPTAKGASFMGWLTGASGGLNGSLTTTISSTGKITAKVTTAEGTYSFSAASWSEAAGDVYTVSMVTKKGETLVLTLDASKGWNEPQVSGVFNGAYAVTAQRNPALNKNDEAYSAVSGMLWKYSVPYTLGLEGEVIPGSTGEVENIPEGCGYLTATVNEKKGTVKFAGKLADGTSVSGSSTLAIGDGFATVPCFFPLYSKRGFCSGMLEITEGVLWGVVASPEDWQWHYPGKSPAVKAPATEDRFGMRLKVGGGPYDLMLYDTASFYYGNEQLWFLADPYDVNLVIAKSLKLPTGKKPVYDKVNQVYVYDTDNPGVATFSLNKATGVFKGKFNLYDEYYDAKGALKLKTVAVAHQGVLLPNKKWFQNDGMGYSLVSETWYSNDPTPVKYTIKRSSPVYIIGQ